MHARQSDHSGERFNAAGVGCLPGMHDEKKKEEREKRRGLGGREGGEGGGRETSCGGFVRCQSQRNRGERDAIPCGPVSVPNRDGGSA